MWDGLINRRDLRNSMVPSEGRSSCQLAQWLCACAGLVPHCKGLGCATLMDLSCSVAAAQGFQEGTIRFPPTFKFLPGSSAYSEMRVPSWTDRILWKVRSGPQQQQQQLEPQPQLSWVNGEGSMTEGSTAPAPVPPCVSQLYYTSVPDITSSDHKPVIAGFQLGVVGEEEEEQRSTHSSDESDDEGLNAKRSRCCFM